MKFWKYAFVFLLLILSGLIIAIFQIPDSRFHIIACNVGEGDATLVIYKNIQILVDGGPDKKVLDCLGRHVPFYDREIELVILTHPDSDHFAGLIDVFKNYKIDNYLYNPVKISKPEYGLLQDQAQKSKAQFLYPYNGQRLKVGMIYLDTLAPNGGISNSKLQITNQKVLLDSETNSLSIVSLVSFGKFKALLTGDMTPVVSDSLSAMQLDGPINYIKIPHHGSKNGLTQSLLEKLRPSMATISVGKNNYGHPDGGIIKMLNDYGVKIFRTDEVGDIEVVTNGERYWIK